MFGGGLLKRLFLLRRFIKGDICLWRRFIERDICVWWRFIEVAVCLSERFVKRGYLSLEEIYKWHLSVQEIMKRVSIFSHRRAHPSLGVLAGVSVL